MTTPTFSIVIPLYNKAAYVRRTIDSVLAQTVPDFQLIVVDDGSNDGGAEIVEGINDPRLELIRQANQGPGPARNAGMAHARAEWIALLDADDYWFADHLEELGRIAQAHPDAGLIFTCAIARPSGEEIVYQPPSSSRIERTDYLFGRKGRLNCTPSAAIPRHVFDETGGFRNYPHGQDTEFFVRVCLSYPVYISNRITVRVTRHTGGIMDGRAARRAEKSATVKSLEEIAANAPSFAFALKALAEDAYPESSERLRAYLNHRLQHFAGKAVQYGQMARARSIMRLLIGPVPTKVRMYQFLLYLPGFMAGSIIPALNRRNFRKQRKVVKHGDIERHGAGVDDRERQGA